MLAKVPDLDPGLVEDVIWGCGQPAGEAGINIGRVAGILAGIDAPGVTVNRYCSSSLQTIRMAGARDQGRRRRRVHRGRCRDREPLPVRRGRHRPAQREVRRSARAHQGARAQAVSRRGRRPPGFPDVYIAMGQTAENVREVENVGRTEMDEFAVQSQERAVAAQAQRLLRP